MVSGSPLEASHQLCLGSEQKSNELVIVQVATGPGHSDQIVLLLELVLLHGGLINALELRQERLELPNLAEGHRALVE